VTPVEGVEEEAPTAAAVEPQVETTPDPVAEAPETTETTETTETETTDDAGSDS
jgi:hypothetical protein